MGEIGQDGGLRKGMCRTQGWCFAIELIAMGRFLPSCCVRG